MHKRIGGLAALLATFALGTAAGHAATISDPQGDLLASYQGPKNADLDVTSFSVDLEGSDFLISGTLAGNIDTSGTGVYIIGINTGTGHIAPFGNIGEPNVIFDQTIAVFQNGTAKLGQTNLSGISISGNTFTVDVSSKLFPSTGFTAEQYAFNLWPSAQLGVEAQIADFAPQNAMISVGVSTVPLPGSLPMFGAALLVLGAFGANRYRVKAKA